MNNLKIIIVLALFAVISALVIGYGENKYQAGIHHQIAEQEKIDTNAENKAVDVAVERNEAIDTNKEEWLEKGLELSEVKPEVKYETITKIITVETCTNRGSDYVRLWNDHADAFDKAGGIIAK